MCLKSWGIIEDEEQTSKETSQVKDLEEVRFEY